MRRPIWILSAALVMVMGASAAAPAAGLTVGLHDSRRIALSGSAANVVVADPSVADVAMVDSHSIVVIGKGFGVTEILVTDHAGHTLMDTRVAVVGSDSGRVTVYRGETVQDYSCAGRCQQAAAGSLAPAGLAAGPGYPTNTSGVTTMTITTPAPVLHP